VARNTYPPIYPQQLYRAKRALASILLLFVCIPCFCQEQPRYIYIHFLYGSKPAAGCKHIEKKWFGGLHGGHVSIQCDSIITGFEPARGCHIFPHNRKKDCRFLEEEFFEWAEDTVGLKYLSITIPVSQAQLDSVRAIQKRYVADPPFDYAFFGMRCAASTYFILSQVGIVPERSRFFNILTHFYPKPLRKKMIKMAKIRGYKMERHEGRKSRRWEKDHFFGAD
jgi:hypothetical protein